MGRTIKELNYFFRIFLLLTSKEQVDDSKYFLSLLKDKNERNEVRPILTGFLAVSRGIPDHLLEEYNIKLGLNIPITARLTDRIFEEKANKQNNSMAQSFISFYKKEFKDLDQNTLWTAMKKKRDIKIHRNDIPLNKHFHITISEPPLKFHDRITVIHSDRAGNIKNNSISSQQHVNTISDEKDPIKMGPQLGVKWFFEDDPTTELVDKCEQLLKDMENFVRKIESAFP